MPNLQFDNTDGEMWLMPCRFDGTLEERRDPFTGKPTKMPRNGALTRKEQRAVEAVLEAVRIDGVGNMLKVEDGGVAEFSVEPSSVSLKPRMVPPTKDLAALVYDLLVAGNWCLQTDDVLVVSDPEHAKRLPKEDPLVPAEFFETFPRSVVHIDSAAALAEALGWPPRRRRKR